MRRRHPITFFTGRFEFETRKGASHLLAGTKIIVGCMRLRVLIRKEKLLVLAANYWEYFEAHEISITFDVFLFLSFFLSFFEIDGIKNTPFFQGTTH